jgi:hypothetical protein
MKQSVFHFAVALVVFVLGCSQHDDTPTRHSFIPAPAITSLNIIDDGGGKYTITWNVDDDTAVQYYRVYWFNFLTGALEKVAEPSGTQQGVDIGLEAGGLVFGVSAVTVENIEGAMATAVTPEPSAGP